MRAALLRPANRSLSCEGAIEVPNARRAVIVVENSFVPADVRVTYEAITLRDAGWDVIVICPFAQHAGQGKEASGKTRALQDPEGVHVLRFPLTYAQRGLLAYLREYLTAFVSVARITWQVWRNGSFDVLHLCNPPDIFFPIAALYRLLGVRVIFDHHDLFPELVDWRYRGLRRQVLYALARAAEYLTFRVANVVMSTNESYRRIAIKRGRLPGENVIVVRNGPRLDEFVPVKPDPALKKGFRYMACYAGVMGHDDGVLELIPSIAHIVHDLGRHDVRFVLLGDGAVRREAFNQIETQGLSSYVEMPGMIYDNELLRRYMCTADVLLSPEPPTPLNTSSTFIKIGEYMAMGKPIVAYDLVETKRTADAAAVYVEPGNIEAFGQAIVDLLDDPERRKQMGVVGKWRVRHLLAWEHQQEHLLAAYERALNQR